MSLDKDTVKNIANLARIKVADEDLELLAVDLSHIIDWVEQLSKVNTDGIEPMTSVANMELFRREDEVIDGGIPEKVLANAPDRKENFYTVPKVVE